MSNTPKTSVDPNTIINLIASLLPSVIGLYNSLVQQYGGANTQTVEQILSTADANWDAVAAAAKKELS